MGEKRARLRKGRADMPLTNVLTAMIEPKEQISLEEAKKMAAEEAAKEVEARWNKQKSTT
ncbi:unnamed protein product [marine sediment metagenome]|uniref:Uncharacterized protein n=1 Tax=marine sediment metagenome TaxID=412755 RepID=X1IMQ7_9ZZZZ